MGSYGDLNNWLDAGSSELIDGGRDLAQKFSQKYFRGPQVLLYSFESGLLDAPLIRLGAEPESAVKWITPIAEKSAARWDGAGDPGIDSGIADGLVSLARKLGRPLTDYDVVEAILGSELGMMSHEMRGCPFSLDDLCVEVTRRRKEKQVVSSKSTPNSKAAPVSAQMQNRFDESLTKYATNTSETTEELSAGLYEFRLEEVERIGGVLERLTRRNPLIVGDSGVGKTALVEGLAKWLKTDAAPEGLKGTEIYTVSCTSLVAGVSHPGELAERVQKLIDAAIIRKNILLFLDEIHVLADTAGAGSSNVLGLFNQYLSRGSFRMIASVITKDFEGKIKSNEGFLRRFEVVKLEEPDKDQTAKMLEDHLPAFRKHYDMEISEAVLDAIVTNCELYMTSRRFPDKAISTLDSACQRVRLAAQKNGESSPEVDVPSVLAVIAEEAKIPISRLDEMEQIKLRGLRGYLEERVFDQFRATGSLSQSIQSMRLGLKDPNRTGAAFLFVGPPGTGKTELAKALAEYLMGSERALVRFNMSEFQTPESYQRLIGPPPGYVGYEEGGELTNRLSENPYSVVLFDEIEKGSSRVFDVFLQVLSDGHLNDNHGRVVDCKNSVFIMTSNALADVCEHSDSEVRELLLQYQDPFKAQMGPTFRREFIDRLEIVPFDSLSDNTLNKILQREISRVLDQVNNSELMKCKISVADDAMHWLVSQVDSSMTGARSIQRLVESKISRPIGDWFVQGTMEKGKEFVLNISDDGEIKIDHKP